MARWCHDQALLDVQNKLRQTQYTSTDIFAPSAQYENVADRDDVEGFYMRTSWDMRHNPSGASGTKRQRGTAPVTCSPGTVQSSKQQTPKKSAPATREDSV